VMSNKVTPGFIMNQIRNGVRVNNSISEIKPFEYVEDTEHGDKEINEIMNRMSTNIKRLNHRITPNMPVAFIQPHLVSRFRFIGKILVPIRRLGTRLFTKWYVDTFSNQQKHLNHDIWFGINASIEIINDQNKIISHLIKENYERLSENEDLNGKIRDLIKNDTLDFDYSKFAERFAADPNEVKRIYAQYIQHFKDCNNVLDIGCGKGYFLELLNENNITAIGIDSDADLIETCKVKGLTAYKDDAIHYLENSADNSLDGIFMGHVIEHLPLNIKIKFLELCLAKLVTNGVLILETPNTTSSYVMHNLYYLDPTHEKPLFPEALKHICEVTGFSVVNSYLSELINEDSQAPNHYYNYSLILIKKSL
jgi:2-polyprenyl-3-methyl-5-hydroxy-6-metoxy-1,4-benzoquinol methylase